MIGVYAPVERQVEDFLQHDIKTLPHFSSVLLFTVANPFVKKDRLGQAYYTCKIGFALPLRSSLGLHRNRAKAT
jgi:hypothetical protein